MVPKSKSLIDWRSGGWVLLLASALVLAVAARLAVPLLRRDSGAVGDGRNVETYGFDLATSLIPRESIRASGLPRDGIPVLDEPPVMSAADVDRFNESRRGKYLVGSDRVIGVMAGGQARAYPLRVLNWHEIVNDTLGGVPIVVTYNPLCDSVAAFDRRLPDGVARFGFSGLIFNSNSLLYDRRPGDRGLWSQLQARAVTGPEAHAGLRLRARIVSLASWSHWKERHPDTDVLRPLPGYLQRYQRDPYGSYLEGGHPRFPVSPQPPADSPPPMSPILVVETDLKRAVYPLAAGSLTGLAAAAERQGVAIDVDDSLRPASFVVTGPDGAATFYCRWFAWYSQHPETALAEIATVARPAAR